MFSLLIPSVTVVSCLYRDSSLPPPSPIQSGCYLSSPSISNRFSYYAFYTPPFLSCLHVVAVYTTGIRSDLGNTPRTFAFLSSSLSDTDVQYYHLLFISVLLVLLTSRGPRRPFPRFLESYTESTMNVCMLVFILHASGFGAGYWTYGKDSSNPDWCANWANVIPTVVQSFRNISGARNTYRATSTSAPPPEMFEN